MSKAGTTLGVNQSTKKLFFDCKKEFEKRIGGGKVMVDAAMANILREWLRSERDKTSK
jgi:hypothetical protein